MSEVKKFESGASSSKEKSRYDLIPRIANKLNADRFGYGAVVHGDNNYKKGAHDEKFIRDRFNHLAEHVMKLVESGLDAESAADDLGAILCNASILAELRRIRLETPVAVAPVVEEIPPLNAPGECVHCGRLRPNHYNGRCLSRTGATMFKAAARSEVFSDY